MMHGDIDHNEWRSWRTDTTHLPNLNFYVFDWHPLGQAFFGSVICLAESVGAILVAGLGFADGFHHCGDMLAVAGQFGCFLPGELIHKGIPLGIVIIHTHHVDQGQAGVLAIGRVNKMQTNREIEVFRFARSFTLRRC